MAADIDEAIADVVEDVSNNLDLARMNLWLVTFTAAIPGPGVAFNEESLDERSVRNWYAPTIFIRDQLQSGVLGVIGESLSVIRVASIVSRTLFATKLARINSRITQDQEDSVVAQYTVAWE